MIYLFALPVPMMIPSAIIIGVSSLLEIFSRMRGDLLRWPLGESSEVVLSLTALLFMIEVLRDRQRQPRLVCSTPGLKVIVTPRAFGRAADGRR